MNSTKQKGRTFQNPIPLGEFSRGSVRLAFTLIFLILSILIFRFVFVYSGFPGLGVRYLIIPPAIFLAALYFGARYVQDIYELPSLSLALKYLLACLFSLGIPHLEVDQGKKRIQKDEQNLLDHIGGPGYLFVQPGNVVLCERMQRLPRVRPAGRHRIHRFETIKEIVSLEEQYGEIDRVSARTKDGIEVVLSDVRFRYRLYSSQSRSLSASPRLENPYPYNEKAVLNMVYNRHILPEGMTSWHDEVKHTLNAAITQYVTQHPIDRLISPSYSGGDPRGEIYKLLYSRTVQDQLQMHGAELLWCDIGHFEVPEKQVSEQQLSMWQARRSSSMNAVRAFSDAQRSAYQELGRAEAQAEILMTFLHALEGVQQESVSTENRQSILLDRASQLLDSLAQPVGGPAEAQSPD